MKRPTRYKSTNTIFYFTLCNSSASIDIFFSSKIFAFILTLLHSYSEKCELKIVKKFVMNDCGDCSTVIVSSSINLRNLTGKIDGTSLNSIFLLLIIWELLIKSCSERLSCPILIATSLIGSSMSIWWASNIWRRLELVMNSLYYLMMIVQ